MTSYLFGWNPSVWPWDEMAQDRSSIIAGQTVTYNWQCANSHAQPGDIAWIIRYGAGVEPKGIVAKGRIISEPYPDHHPIYPDRMTPHVRIKIEEIRAEGDIISTSLLEREYPDQKWNPRNSGIMLKPHAVECVERRW